MSDSCGTQWVYKYVAVDVYSTLYIYIGWTLYYQQNLREGKHNYAVLRESSQLLLLM